MKKAGGEIPSGLFVVFSAGLRLDFGQDAVDAILTNPAVDEPFVIADLKPIVLNGGDQVQVLVSTNLAENYVALVQQSAVGHRLNRAEIAALDAACHGVALGPKLDRLTRLKASDVSGRPTHLSGYPG